MAAGAEARHQRPCARGRSPRRRGCRGPGRGGRSGQPPADRAPPLAARHTFTARAAASTPGRGPRHAGHGGGAGACPWRGQQPLRAGAASGNAGAVARPWLRGRVPLRAGVAPWHRGPAAPTRARASPSAAQAARAWFSDSAGTRPQPQRGGCGLGMAAQPRQRVHPPPWRMMRASAGHAPLFVGLRAPVTDLFCSVAVNSETTMKNKRINNCAIEDSNLINAYKIIFLVVVLQGCSAGK
uniref:Uncharacterized protein n=1 Tax=Zea mays TaxID=4577 RepID=B6SRI8_MAIZE|nr:hypothetical protein [Zea mays]